MKRDAIFYFWFISLTWWPPFHPFSCGIKCLRNTAFNDSHRWSLSCFSPLPCEPHVLNIQERMHRLSSVGPHLSRAVCGKLLPHLSFSHHIHSMSPLNPSTHFPPLCNLNYFLKMGIWLRHFYWSFLNGFILFFKIKIKSSSISSHLPSFSYYALQ